MTRPLGEYFAHRMRDPEYAAAYHALDAEDQAERARISTRLLAGPAHTRPTQVRDIFGRYPRLLELLALLNLLPQPAQLATAPGQMTADTDFAFQISSEALYDLDPVSTEVTYHADIL